MEKKGRWLRAAGLLLMAALWMMMLTAGAEEEFITSGSKLVKYNGTAENVVIPDGVTVIGGEAFNDTNARTVVVPEGVVTIDAYAFGYCPKLEEITLPASLKNLMNGNFANCYELKAIHVAEGSQSFSSVDGVLYDNRQVQLVRYPSGREGKSYEIPEGVAALGSDAFSGTRLETLIFPSTLTFIPTGSLQSTWSLKEFIVHEDNPRFASPNGVLCSKSGKTLDSWPASKMRDGEIAAEDFPESIQTIGQKAFMYNNARAVTLPGTITQIGEQAFFNMTELETVEIPESVQTIAGGCFSACWNLKTVTIHGMETDLGRYAQEDFFESAEAVILAHSGSKAEEFCSRNNLPFLSLDMTEEEWQAVEKEREAAREALRQEELQALRAERKQTREAQIEAWEAENPTATRQQGQYTNVPSRTLFFNSPNAQQYGMHVTVFPAGERIDYEAGEDAVIGRITMIAGDESMEDIFALENYGANGFSLQPRYDLLAGEGSATYRVDVASEHYWASTEFEVEFVDASRISFTVNEEALECVAGERVESYNIRLFEAQPAVTDRISFSFTAPGEDYTSEFENDQYRIENGNLTAKAAGEFQVDVRISMGENYREKRTVTMHAISAEEADKNWQTAWPPKGKTKGARTDTNSHSDWNGTYFINGEESHLSGLAPFYISENGQDSGEEVVQTYHVTFLSGDESLRRFYYPGYYGGADSEAAIQLNWSGVTQSGTAEFLMSMESEHYWAEETVRIVIMDAADVEMELISSEVNAPVDEEFNISDLFEDREFVTCEPAFEYSCYFQAEEGNYESISDQEGYLLEYGWRFTGKQPGDYTLYMHVSIGRDGYDRVFPITVHVSEDCREAAVIGDAPMSAKAIREQEEALKRERERLQERVREGETLTDTEQGSYIYRMKEQNAEITYAVSKGEELIIPATLDGHPVSAVENTFYSDKVRTITVEEGVRRIGRYAFNGLSETLTVQLPDSVTSIEEGAFSGLGKLQELTLPRGLTLDQIGRNAFSSYGQEDILLADGTSLMKASAEAYAGEGKYSEMLVMSVAGDGYEYLVAEDGSAIILSSSAYEIMHGGNVLEVPQTLNGHPVRVIAEEAFARNEDLWNLILPEGLEAIGDRAFSECRNLTAVQFPSTLKEIGDRAFSGVAAEELTLPEGVNAAVSWFTQEKTDSTGTWTYQRTADGNAIITGYAYTSKLVFPEEVDGCPVVEIDQVPYSSRQGEKDAVRQITLPDSLQILGEYAFSSMRNVKTLKLPAGLKRVEKNALSYMGLTSVTLPDGLEYLGESALSGNPIKSLALPAGITRIEPQAFSGTKLTSLTLPESVKEIGEGAFEYCQLKTLKLPESLEIIGDRAFHGHELSELKLPESLRKVGNAAFAPNGESKLKKVTFLNPVVELGKGIFGYDDGYSAYRREHAEEIEANSGQVDYDSRNPDNWTDYYADYSRRDVPTITMSCLPGSTADQLYQYNTKKTYLKWDESHIVTAPADRVLQAGLYSQEDLVYELIIPEGVEEIADEAFAGLKTLSRVTLPSTLKKIGAKAFNGCGALSEVTIPKTVTEIGEHCFAGCVNLKEISLPEVITEIPAGAFLNCSSLSKLSLPKKGLVRIGDDALMGCTALKSLQLGKELEEIGAQAFRGVGVQNLKLPDTVTSIGDAAFRQSAITGLTLPKGIKEVPEMLCADCANLKTVKLPDGIISIGNAAFAGCYSLSSVNFPEGLETIGMNAFLQNADGVKYAYFYGKKYAALASVKLPASLKTIQENAFACCDALTTVSFAKGSQLTEIGTDAFAMCMRLKEIKLPDGLRKMGDYVFVNCLGLKKADLGAGITECGTSVFMYCEAMTALTVPDTLTAIGEKMLEGHGEKLKVTCGEGSAMEAWLQTNYPEVTVVHPGK